MFGTHDLLLFVVSALLLNITPGPDTLYIVGRSSTQGLRAGVVAALGIGAGIMVHITAAALGVSAIFAASATAFTVLKLAGAVYLVYVGISLMRARSVLPGPPVAPPPAALRTIFVQGLGGVLVRGEAASAWFNRCVGALFVYLGARLALERS